MKKLLSKFSPNWIAAFLLLGAFVVSAVRFYTVSRTTSGSGEVSGKVIRVAHWQLEPGFREALQWAMDEYNNLPEVKEAGVSVMQTPIAERVYNQFMNVHLISGTAPDIAVKNSSELIKGNALAKFYAPLGSYTASPNPYNQPEFQVEGLPTKLSTFLSDTKWKDTFFDGLQGGYEETLSDYYAIPICTWGGMRFIYNLRILGEVKDYAANLAAEATQPEWMSGLWRTAANEEGYLPEASALAWLKTDEVPQTLGQFMFYCAAVQAYAADNSDAYLVPIAGSKYSANDIATLYSVEFLSAPWKELSLELGKKSTALEALAAFDRGLWSFDSPFLREMIEFQRLVCQFYPNGFLGLDREQAQRRFVLGQAAILSTGGWDATSIYQGIAERSDPKDRFEVNIAIKPLAVEGERWFEFLDMRSTEADAKGGVPFAINKQSPNFDWALDFLRFLSSHRINEGFSQRAGWLPVIVGAKPPERVAAFMPYNEGIPKTFRMQISESTTPANIRNAWSSNLKLVKTGDLEGEVMFERVKKAIEDPVNGLHKAWIFDLIKAKDQSRANQRSMSVERLNYILGEAAAAKRERASTYLNLIEDEGVHLRRWWHELHPSDPYPEY
ncbi:extracellular solute-binding protein [Coraliomargarita parva]|uniref:extracellular solute-binding protein n=1 Tax=Coraliomargarita parva TaxID=3014050 RepID=UPI0022B42152|nr:extracellular solute-binding protein [Coraliomargarita parva]